MTSAQPSVVIRSAASRAAWSELSLIVGVLMVAMVGAMWAQRPASGCAMGVDAPRALVLSRDIDREHLAADVASASRVAYRDARSIADPAERQARFADCEATLSKQIATTHGLSSDHVLADITAAQ